MKGKTPDMSSFYDLSHFPSHLKIGAVGKCDTCHDGKTRASLANFLLNGRFSESVIFRKINEEKSMPMGVQLPAGTDLKDLTFKITAEYITELKKWLTETKCDTTVAASRSLAKGTRNALALDTLMEKCKATPTADAVAKLAALSGGAAVSQEILRASAVQQLKMCQDCHVDKSSGPANRLFVAETSGAELKRWLLSKPSGQDLTWLEMISFATDFKRVTPKIKKMPPFGDMGKEARSSLLGYLTSVALSRDGTGASYACESVAGVLDAQKDAALGGGGGGSGAGSAKTP